MTAPNAVELTELELDALTEIVNLGVSKAATSLALMVHDEVVLSVPKVPPINSGTLAPRRSTCAQPSRRCAHGSAEAPLK